MPPLTPDTLRHRLLRDARRLLQIQHGHHDPAATITVVVATGPVAVATTDMPRSPSNGGSHPPPPGERPPVQSDILAALPAEPIGARRLARLSGRRYGSYFRTALIALVRAGLVHQVGRTYCRP